MRAAPGELPATGDIAASPRLLQPALAALHAGVADADRAAAQEAPERGHHGFAPANCVSPAPSPWRWPW